MSKASEWSKALRDRPAWKAPAPLLVFANVTDRGALEISSGGAEINVPATSAVSLARWILETFEDKV